jgi:glycosyltransferase involved in cell wall biosynthesis
MKLAFVLPYCETSGGARVGNIVAEGLLRRGHDVRMLCRAPSLEGRARSMWRGILRGPDWRKEFSGEVGSFRYLSQCSFRHGEIIVGLGMEMSCQVGLLDLISNPRVQYLHGSTPWDPALRDRALKAPIPKIVVASFLKELVETTGRGEVLAVVPNGVDFSVYYPAVPEAERDGIGAMYSSFAVQKDPATVLGAVESIRKARPKVPVRVFGGSRRPKELVSEVYSRYPSLRQAREIYSRSQIWILGSREEGFGLPVLEAMACGCAVIATDCGGPRDLITDGETGFLVPVGDVRAIVDRALMLLDDPPLRERIRTNSLNAVKRFSWERCILQLESALEKAV